MPPIFGQAVGAVGRGLVRWGVDLAGEVMGPGWVAPERFRFGASGLVDDLLART